MIMLNYQKDILPFPFRKLPTVLFVIEERQGIQLSSDELLMNQIEKLKEIKKQDSEEKKQTANLIESLQCSLPELRSCCQSNSEPRGTIKGGVLELKFLI